MGERDPRGAEDSTYKYVSTDVEARHVVTVTAAGSVRVKLKNRARGNAWGTGPMPVDSAPVIFKYV